MVEGDFINKIRGLRQIRPSKNWVVLTKKRIFEEESIKEPIIAQQIHRGRASTDSSFVSLNRLFGEIRVVFNHKFAFATVFSLIILFGVLGFAKSSLPGDFLFPIKRMAEKGQAIFISQKDQSDYDLEMAQKRLKDLTKVIQDNSVEKLAPAINEYQANVSKIADNLTKERDSEKIREMVLKVQELDNQEKQLETLGAVIGENEEMNKAYAQQLIETLEPFIEDLKNSSLTEEQQKVLVEVEKDLTNKDYQDALLKLLIDIKK